MLVMFSLLCRSPPPMLVWWPASPLPYWSACPDWGLLHYTAALPFVQTLPHTGCNLKVCFTLGLNRWFANRKLLQFGICTQEPSSAKRSLPRGRASSRPQAKRRRIMVESDNEAEAEDSGKTAVLGITAVFCCFAKERKHAD